MSQSAIRESTISSAGSATSTAPRTSSRVISASARGRCRGPARRRPRPRPAAAAGCASRSGLVPADVHVVEQVAEVGLVDAELVLDCLGGGADLATRPRVAPAASRRCTSPCCTAYAAAQVVGADQVAHRRRTGPGSPAPRRAAATAAEIDVLRGHGPILEPVTVSCHDTPGARRAAEVDVVVVGAGGAGMTAALGRGATASTPSCSRRAATSAARPPAAAAACGSPATTRCGPPARWPTTSARVQALPRRRSSATWCPRSAATPTSTAAPRSWTSSSEQTPVRFTWVPQYADYHPERPAAAPAGRSVEPVPLDARFLGDELERLHPAYTKAPANLIVTQADFRKISLGLRTLRGPAHDGQGAAARIVSMAARPEDVRHGQRARDRPAQGPDRRRRAGRTTTPS